MSTDVTQWQCRACFSFVQTSGEGPVIARAMSGIDMGIASSSPFRRCAL